LVEEVLSGPSEISLEEGRFLGGLAQGVPDDGCIVEVGTLFGFSTRVLAMFKPAAARLIAIDNFAWNPLGLSRHQHARLTRVLLADAIEHQNVELREIDKAAFYRSFGKGTAPPSMVFLDADHGYEATRQDILWAQEVGAKVICGHDYSEEFPGVVRAVKECGGAERVVGSVFLLRSD
jgi:predicted O-methyltransferase YrrM